jgi:hypothetical protein
MWGALQVAAWKSRLLACIRSVSRRRPSGLGSRDVVNCFGVQPGWLRERITSAKAGSIGVFFVGMDEDTKPPQTLAEFNL